MQSDIGPRLTPFPVAGARRRGAPFPHFVASQPLAPELVEAAYEWLDAEAPWHRNVSYFFDQFECDLLSMDLPPLLREGLTSPATLQFFRQRMEALFGVSLANVFSVTAHRLVPGQGIGLHNDEPGRGDETHRLVVHLGPNLGDQSGGHLMFFNSPEPDDIACAFRNVPNTAVGFACSSRSHHAVTEINAGVRYTVVYSFWRTGWADAEETHGERIEGEDWRPFRPRRTRRAPHASAGRPLDALVQMLVEAGAARTPDPDLALLPDLVATYELLRRWRCSDALCLAGLFCGIYGSESSTHRLIPLRQRDRVREAIGEAAEALVYAGCTASEKTVLRALIKGEPGLVLDRWRRTSLGIDMDTLVDLITLTMAHDLARHDRVQATDAEWEEQYERFALAEPYLDARVHRALCREFE